MLALTGGNLMRFIICRNVILHYFYLTKTKLTKPLMVLSNVLRDIQMIMIVISACLYEFEFSVPCKFVTKMNRIIHKG